jgi:hypothetical protein
MQERDTLGWESRFLVPISGTPIISGILILYSIPKILVGFFLKFRCLESQKIGIPILIFGIPVISLHRNSVRLIIANLY